MGWGRAGLLGGTAAVGGAGVALGFCTWALALLAHNSMPMPNRAAELVFAFMFMVLVRSMFPFVRMSRTRCSRCEAITPRNHWKYPVSGICAPRNSIGVHDERPNTSPRAAPWASRRPCPPYLHPYERSLSGTGAPYPNAHPYACLDGLDVHRPRPPREKNDAGRSETG